MSIASRAVDLDGLEELDLYFEADVVSATDYGSVPSYQVVTGEEFKAGPRTGTPKRIYKSECVTFPIASSYTLTAPEGGTIVSIEHAYPRPANTPDFCGNYTDCGWPCADAVVAYISGLALNQTSAVIPALNNSSINPCYSTAVIEGGCNVNYTTLTHMNVRFIYCTEGEVNYTDEATLDEIYCEAEALVEGCKGLCKLFVVTDEITGQVSVGTTEEQQNVANILGGGYFDLSFSESCVCPNQGKMSKVDFDNNASLALVRQLNDQLEIVRASAAAGGERWDVGTYLTTNFSDYNPIVNFGGCDLKTVYVHPGIPSRFGTYYASNLNKNVLFYEFNGNLNTIYTYPNENLENSYAKCYPSEGSGLGVFYHVSNKFNGNGVMTLETVLYENQSPPFYILSGGDASTLPTTGSIITLQEYIDDLINNQGKTYEEALQYQLKHNFYNSREDLSIVFDSRVEEGCQPVC